MISALVGSALIACSGSPPQLTSNGMSGQGGTSALAGSAGTTQAGNAGQAASAGGSTSNGGALGTGGSYASGGDASGGIAGSGAAGNAGTGDGASGGSTAGASGTAGAASGGANAGSAGSSGSSTGGSAGASGASGSGGAGAGGTAGAGASGGTGGSSGGAGGSAGYLFYDPFESDANLKLLTNGTSTAVHAIADGGAFAGSAHHLSITGDDSNTGFYSGLHYIFVTPIQPSSVSYWARVSPSAFTAAYFTLFGNASNSTPIATLVLGENQYAMPPATLSYGSTTTGTDNGTPLAPNVWYHFELDFVWTSSGGSYTVKLDDTPLSPVTAFTSMNIVRLDIFSGEESANSDVDFDDITMLP